ncbi:hypothetical protein OS493_026703 [Desmophyllum pertusum]|uniref:Kinesin light chain n=1 Tax=Desmophyllum pertusum TaxID=174260 RepID=A0A9X0D949_9CNID|nr:hypothetical protein OS493_026703 [Desmophyllum pertusum]
MEPQDASSLLAKLSAIVNSEIENEVAQALDYQPLALASAATYIRQVRQNKATSNFGWKDYLNKLDTGQRGTTEAIHAETNPSYQKSMTAATTLAVERQMTSDRVIDHTFRFLYLCAPQPLSLDIVINYILNVDEEIKDKETISMRIQRCSLLLFEEQETGVYIRVHQVVHDVISTVITDLPEIQRLQVVNGAVRSFTQFIDENKSEDSNLGTVHRDLGELQQAKEYHDRALDILLEKLGPEHVDVARTYNNLGSVHSKLGEPQREKECHDRALAILLKKLGPEHVDVATAYSNLGTVHRNLGELQQAKEYYDRALDIRLKSLDLSINLGIVHSDLGELQQAKEFYDRALAIRLKKLGPEHVDVATTYSNLAVEHSALGDQQQAKDYHDRALAIYLKKLGPEHVDVARVYNNLGHIHSKLGDQQQAKEYYDRALAIYLKKLGPEHVDVARAYNNLGTVHIKLGELLQAKEYQDRALAIFLKKLGLEHVDVATTYCNLGTIHIKLGKLLQAKEYHDRALAIFLKRSDLSMLMSQLFSII